MSDKGLSDDSSSISVSSKASSYNERSIVSSHTKTNNTLDIEKLVVEADNLENVRQLSDKTEKEERIEPHIVTSVAPSTTSKTTVTKLPSYSNVSLPSWPWGIVSSIQSAVDHATMASEGNVTNDNKKLLDLTRDAINKYMPPRVPSTNIDPLYGKYRKALNAHENDGALWKHTLGKVLNNITENMEKAQGLKTFYMKTAMSEMDQIDRVTNAHMQKISTIKDPKMRENAERILKSRVNITVNALENDTKNKMKEAMRNKLMNHYEIPLRNVENENKTLKTILSGCADDNELLMTVDAVNNYHKAIIRQELERWNMFLTEQNRRMI